MKAYTIHHNHTAVQNGMAPATRPGHPWLLLLPMLAVTCALLWRLPAAHAQDPTLTSHEPITNSVAVPLNSSVVLTYNTAINSASVTSRTVAVHSMLQGLVTTTHSVDGSVVTVSPVRSFFPGELVYTVATTRTAALDSSQTLTPTIWQFNAGVTQGWGRFSSTPVNIGAGSDTTWSVAWGDYDNDGDLDLAVGNDGQNAVYPNNSNGTFGEAINFGPGNDATRIVAWGDFDNDGDLDIAVGNIGAQNAVYPNNGDGTFGPAITFGPANDMTNSLAWGDMDNDGDLDLAVGNLGDPGNSQPSGVYLNNGNSTFAVTLIPFGSLSAQEGGNGIAWGDFNGDGKLDIAVANGGGDNGVYLNTGNRTFGATPVTFGQYGNNVAWGDMDNDGDLDIVVDHFMGNSQVYPNNGNGTFGTPVSIGSSGLNTFTWGDFNDDGNLDIAVGTVGNRYDQNMIYPNNGNGTFGTAVNFGPSTEKTSSLAWGDFDNDGDLDLAVGNNGQNGIYLNEPLFACPSANPIYVDRNATGDKNGDSWADAYPDLQTGLSVARLCAGLNEIWVATGVYTPGLTRSDTFTATSGMQLYGGFAATETMRTQRDWVANPTVLSGDIGGDDIQDSNGVVTTTAHIVGTNAYHVLWLDGVNGDPITTTTVVDGFLITAGKANGVSPHDSGGGIFCAGQGSGNACSPFVANVAFRGNMANFSGGAMFNNGNDSGISSPSLAHVSFSGNSASQGGAMCNDSVGSGISSPSLVNVVFSENRASSMGGAMANIAQQNGLSSPSLTNLTFSGNSASAGGAMVNNGLEGASSPSLVNVILWGNTADDGAQLFNNYATPIIRNTLVPSTSNAIFNWGGTITWEAGNITDTAAFTTSDIFVDADSGNLRLAANSPAIDVGDNSAVPSGVTTDLDGNARIQNGIVDMGAYEASPKPSVTVAKAVSPDSAVSYGGIITYTLRLGNTSVEDPAVLLTDTLPAEVVFAGWIEQSSATVDNGVVAWNGAVNAGTPITIAFQVTNTASSGATITNTAWFSGSAQAGSATATYTTSTTLAPSGPGNWSEVFPPCMGVCDYVIPNGVAVTLDQNIDLSGNLTVEAGGSFNANGKTVTLTGDQPQTLTGNPVSFYNLVINKSNATDTVTIVGKLKSTKKMRIISGRLISASDYVDIEIDESGTMSLTNDITIAGNLIVTGTFDTNGYAVTFDGGVDQSETVTQTFFLDGIKTFADINVYTNTLLVETSPSNSGVNLEGTLTNYGTIRNSQPVEDTGFYYFGLAGIYPDASAYGMEIEVTDLTGADPLTAIQVDRIDANHPNAPGSASTDIYWTITPSGTDYVATVVLPQNALTSPGACRYSEAVWQCDRTRFNSTDDLDDYYLTVTREGVTAFSDWTVFETEPTTTTLATSGSSVEAGMLVTFTATVEPTSAPGSVEFFADGVSLGSAPVTAGTAQTSTAGLAAGTRVITAIFTPTGLFLPSSGTLSPDQEITCLNGATVANAADSGKDSLRWAIGSVCAGSTVDFNLSYPATITLTSGEIAIDKALTIDGPGAENVTVSGNGASRIFNASADVAIDGLTLRDGVASSGGAIYATGWMTLTNSHLLTNTVQGGYGGAIYLDIGGDLTNVLVEDNRAVDYPTGYGGDGGGIYSSGPLWLTSSTVVSNTASGWNGGGGIFFYLATVVISDTSVSYNRATGDDGGGIASYWDESDAITLTNSIIQSNWAIDDGAGLKLDMTTAYVENTQFIANGDAVDGGAIHIDYGSSVTLVDNTFALNSASRNGGAIYLYNSASTLVITATEFLSNTAGNEGGATYFNTGGASVVGSLFRGNESVSNGGAIYNSGTSSVANSTLYSNTASTGGGIYVGSGVVTVTNSTVASNSSTNDGGGIANYSSLYLRNSLIANNRGGEQCFNESTLVENINNLVADGSCDVVLSGDALLGDLGDYGGDTQTVPLLPGSPAIDAGDAATCLATDQRGIGRVGTCDIGAFESRGFSLAQGTGDDQSTPWAMAFSAPLTVSVSSSYTEPVDGGQITYVGPLSGAGITPITNTATIVGGAGVFTPTANNTLGIYNVTVGAAGAIPDITYTLTNTQRASATMLTSSPNPSIFGQSVTFTATVTDSLGTPSGAVTFTVNSTQVSAAMVDGVATYITNTLVVGSHVITATYGGDARYTGSVDDMTQVVNRAATSTALASIPNPSVYGQAVTFTATVTVTPPGMGLPTGVVTFTDGTTELGTGTLDASGVATYTTGSLDAYDGGQSPPSPATHSITAAYGGDDSFAGSTSEALSQVVGKATTTTTLASGLNPSVYGDSVTFTATVMVQAPGAASMPGEDVTFKDSAVTLGTGTLDASGVATYSTSLLSGGVHTITAEYGGRTNLTGSVSSQVVQTVNPADQTISFGQLAGKEYGADAFPVTATASSGLTVVFTSTTPSVCTVSGTTVNLVDNGGCTIRASQAGDGNYNAASDVDRSFNLTCAESIVVNSAADSGYRTLRGAVANLCEGGTITFDAALDNQTIALTSGQIEITKTLTIDGPGADKLAVSGGDASRIFTATVVATVDGLTLRNGSAAIGGAIYATDWLTLTDSYLLSSTAQSGAGGALYLGAGGDLTNVLVQGNSALDGSNGDGGGIASFGPLFVTRSTIISNTAAGDDLGGGGIFISGATAVISGTTISYNQSINDDGGGITLEFRQSNVITMTNSIIQGNTAYDDGAGLKLDNTVAYIENTQFIGNGNAVDGGAMHVDYGSSVTIVGSSFVQNSASDEGGAAYIDADASVLNVTATSFVSNTATAAGGAIYTARPLTITSSSFVSNTASSGVDDGQGGAISFSGGDQHTVVISDTAILSNTAYQRGGGVYVGYGTLALDNSTLSGNAAAGTEELGGALYCDTCIFTIDGTTFTGNEATQGGAFYISDNTAGHYSDVTSSTFTGNNAVSGGDGEGGAIYIDVYEGILITGTAILSNTAGSGGGIYLKTIDLGEGALDLRNSQVAGNMAATAGGGLFNEQGWLRIMDGTTFTANGATNGGAIYNDAWLRVRDAGFNANTARFGGALYNATNGTGVTVDGALFGGNRSDCDGGAIYDAGQINLTASGLYGNQASVNCKDSGDNTIQSIGGAIYVAGQLTVDGSAFHSNNAFGGGALGISGNESYSSTIQVTGSAIYSNSASFAGAVAIGGPSTTRIEQSSIYSNTAMAAGGIGSGFGGAILDIVNTTLAGNRADTLASALFVGDSDLMNNQEGYGPDTLHLRNVTIAGNLQNIDTADPFFAFVGLDNGFGGPTLGITNTIIAAGVGEQACLIGAFTPSVAPSVVTNLDNDGTCGSGFRQTDAILLGPLGEYRVVFRDSGAATTTPITPTLVLFPLLPGSAAIDAGAGSLIFTPPPSSDCPLTDQRGVSRPQGSACDIGAFESQGFTLAKTGGDEQSTPWGSPFANPLSASVSSSHDEPVDGGKITFAGPLSGAGVVPITQTATVVSGAVSVTVSANGTTGAYSVTVAASGAQPIAFSLTNLKHATQTSMQSNLNPAPYSQVVTITASVAISGMTAAGSAPSPTGQVRFSDETGELATVELANGVAAFSRDTWAVGTHTVTAEYLGDTLFAGSTSAPLYQVVGKHATTTNLATAPNPAQAGATVVMTATVEKALSILRLLPPADPTGQVQFRIEGGSVLGTAGLVGNTAVFTKNDFARGVYTIVAEYLGDAGYSGSSSDPVQQVVSPPLTARNDAAGTLQGEAVKIDPLANDIDPAGGGLTVSAVTQPASGSVIIDGHGKTVTFTPDPAVTGIVTFTYTARDVYGITDEALVAVVVTAVNATGHAPQIGVVDNEAGSTLDFDSGAFQVQVQVPAGSYPYPLGDKDIFYLAYTQVVTPTGDIDTPPSDFAFAGMIFDLSAFLNGLDLGHYEFVQPVTLVIDYDPALLGDLSEQLLTPFYWNVTAWVNDGMSITHIDTTAHRMTIQIWHLSEFALFSRPPLSTPIYLFLPAVANGSDLVTAQEAAGVAPQTTPGEATATPEATDAPVPDEAITTPEATVAPEAPADGAGPPAEPAAGASPVPDDAPAADETGAATPPQLHLPLIAR